MSKLEDFEELIQKRLKSLGRKAKSTLSVTKPPKRGPERPPETSESIEGLDKAEASKNAQKLKKKHMNGYKNKQGGKRG